MFEVILCWELAWNGVTGMNTKLLNVTPCLRLPPLSLWKMWEVVASGEGGELVWCPTLKVNEINQLKGRKKSCAGLVDTRGLRGGELVWRSILKVTGDQSTKREKSLALGDTKGTRTLGRTHPLSHRSRERGLSLSKNKQMGVANIQSKLSVVLFVCSCLTTVNQVKKQEKNTGARPRQY